MTDISAIALDTNGYIALPVTTDPNVLLQTAISAIAAEFPGWVPQEGHIEMALLEQFSQMAADTAQVSALVAPVIFQYLGQLYNIPPQNGVAATAPTTWTMIDTQGYTVPAGTVVAYQTLGNTQVQFQTVAAFSVPPGSQATAAGAVQIEAQVVGTANNGISSSTPIVPVQQLAFVQSIAATANTSGGVDPETITAYLNRLSNLLQVSAPRPIEPADFAVIAQSATDTNGNSLGVARALAVNLLNPGRTITAAGITSASPTLTDPAGSFTTADVGRTVTGTDIPGGTTISAYVSTTSVTMSANATATVASESVTLGDLTNVERCCAVCAVDVNGNALSPTVQSELSSYLQARREVNFLVPMLQPTYSTIDVTWAGVAQPGQNTNTVLANGNALIQAFLSSANWAGGSLVPPQWQTGQNVIRYNALLATLADAAGLAYVSSLTFAIHGNTMGTADITIPGDAPLPVPGTISGSVT